MKNIALVTGASSGLGKEFTNQIAEKKSFDEIWIIARRKEKLEEVAANINKKSGKILVRSIPLDIASRQGIFELKALLEQDASNCNQEFSIGLLINNAGFGTYGPFAETPLEKEMEMVDLNCTSLTGICGIVLPFLKKDSVIINTASLAAFLPLGNFAVYAATKAYVLSFTIALAAELKDRGIKVCALCPGSVSTEFANVASNGARKEVKGGHDPVKVVSHCLKKAYMGKKTALWYPKWQFTAFMSHFIGRYFGARFTYKYNPRPYKQD